ncbi:MAG: transglycosylase domain-containing protein, partial [Thermoanaerobaculia bacterium]|nr:transglycosylase domain-containing protein [Thermoanaerobaculia bacterium]
LSPITRSVANALALEPGDPLNRIREYTVAFDLENNLPKARLVELYINTIEFNPTLFGVEAASQHYFGKSAASLNREEAALLIASVGAPEVNLEKPPDWLVARKEKILEAMNDV